MELKESNIKENQRIKSFTDLIVWTEAHKLVLFVYIATKVFPKDERFGITSQMRRAAVSITSNIAEGFSRESYKEKVQFYAIAHGSLTELENQFLISRDVGYLSAQDFKRIIEQAKNVHKLLNAFIKKTKELC